MTLNCVIWKSACATCENSTNGGSASGQHRRQGKLTPGWLATSNWPTPRPASKTFTCYKRRRTKGQIALEAGLGELADGHLFNGKPPDSGSRSRPLRQRRQRRGRLSRPPWEAPAILMERFAEDAGLLDKRQLPQTEATLQRPRGGGQGKEGAKFRDYFERRTAEKRTVAPRPGDFPWPATRHSELRAESWRRTAGHHAPLRRHDPVTIWHQNQGRPADKWLGEVVRWTWKVKLYTHLKPTCWAGCATTRKPGDQRLRPQPPRLLLAAPAGPRATLGLDGPAHRLQVGGGGRHRQAAAGSPRSTRTYRTTSGTRPWASSPLCAKHSVDLIAIGNGTASRETDKLAAELIKKYPAMKMTKVTWSPKPVHRYARPPGTGGQGSRTWTCRSRGAIHRPPPAGPTGGTGEESTRNPSVSAGTSDASQLKLARGLDAVVEDCVNAVGVDVNTASVALLSRISGLNATLAQNIVNHRDEHGAFKTRAALKGRRAWVKTFEQAAGFLRVMNDNPLNASAVHQSLPVGAAHRRRHRPRHSLVDGDRASSSAWTRRNSPMKPSACHRHRHPQELDKPSRDPRPEFKTAEFQDGVGRPLQGPFWLGMILEGVVTNVTSFGAFVDIGVHQDGTVLHLGASEKFIKDPREAVKAGDVVRSRS